MRREGTAGEQRKGRRGRKQYRRQVEVRQCSIVDCLKRRLQRPGSRHVRRREERLEQKQTEKKLLASH